MTLLPIAEMVDSLVLDLTSRDLASIPEAYSFLENVGNLTIRTLLYTIDDGEESCANEAFDFLLEAIESICNILVLFVYLFNLKISLASQFTLDPSIEFQFMQAPNPPPVENISDKICSYLRNFGGLLLQKYLEVRVKNSVELLLDGQKDKSSYFLDWVRQL